MAEMAVTVIVWIFYVSHISRRCFFFLGTLAITREWCAQKHWYLNVLIQGKFYIKYDNIIEMRVFQFFSAARER